MVCSLPSKSRVATRKSKSLLPSTDSRVRCAARLPVACGARTRAYSRLPAYCACMRPSQQRLPFARIALHRRLDWPTPLNPLPLPRPADGQDQGQRLGGLPSLRLSESCIRGYLGDRLEVSVCTLLLPCPPPRGVFRCAGCVPCSCGGGRMPAGVHKRHPALFGPFQSPRNVAPFRLSLSLSVQLCQVSGAPRRHRLWQVNPESAYRVDESSCWLQRPLNTIVALPLLPVHEGGRGGVADAVPEPRPASTPRPPPRASPHNPASSSLFACRFGPRTSPCTLEPQIQELLAATH